MSTPQPLEEPVFESHGGFRRQADTGTEDVGQRRSLLRQRIHHRSSGWRQWRLQHVAENAQDTVKVLIRRCGPVTVLGLPLYSCHHFGNQDEIDDERRGKE